MSRVRIEEVLHDDGLGERPEWEYEAADAPARGERSWQGSLARPGLPQVEIDLVRVPCSLSESECVIEARLVHASWVGRTPTYTVLSVAAPHELCGNETGAVEALGGRVCGRAAMWLRYDLSTMRPATLLKLREWAVRRMGTE